QELITTRAQENATEYPVTGKEPMQAEPLIMRVDAFAVSVQRAYEWIRVLPGYEGERSEIARFKGYTIERGQLLDALKDQLAAARRGQIWPPATTSTTARSARTPAGCSRPWPIPRRRRGRRRGSPRNWRWSRAGRG